MHIDDLPYRAQLGNDTFSPLKDDIPQTEAGKQVAKIAERLRSSSAVASVDITLISLAAVTHPELLNGQRLLWVDARGEPLRAFDPGTPWLWHEEPQQLSSNDKP